MIRSPCSIAGVHIFIKHRGILTVSWCLATKIQWLFGVKGGAYLVKDEGLVAAGLLQQGPWADDGVAQAAVAQRLLRLALV